MDEILILNTIFDHEELVDYLKHVKKEMDVIDPKMYMDIISFHRGEIDLEELLELIDREIEFIKYMKKAD